MNYKMALKELLVGRINFHIHRAENLMDKDIIGISDPFVEIQIDGEEMFRTNVVEENLNPVWDESGSFNVNKEVSEISFLVKDKDKIGANCLGRVSISVQDLGGGNKIEDLFVLDDSTGEDPAIAALLAFIFEVAELVSSRNTVKQLKSTPK